jgi:catechol 2,3-dioxygenase-like lactoylglutathione lyase family enzyme
MQPSIDESITFLPTADLAAARRFYEEDLGLKLRLDQGSCLIFELAPGQHIGFCAKEAPVSPAERVMITLVTQEVDAWYEHIVARGLAPDAPPRLNPTYQIFHFFVTDPSGYLVEVQRFEDPRW